MRKTKKLLALMLLVTILLSSLPLQQVLADNVTSRFWDMQNNWAKSAVEILSVLRVIDGYSDGSFRPNNTITKSEFAKIVRTALKLPLVEGNSFEDTENNWAKNEIHTLAVNNIIIKDEYGSSFQPNKNITRLEMAKMIVRGLGLDEKAKQQENVETAFKDNAEISAADRGHVLIASQNRIINGYPDGRFNPDGEATRAEASQMIVNMFDILGAKTTADAEITEPPTAAIDNPNLSKNLVNPQYISANTFKINGDKVTIDGKTLRADVLPDINKMTINLANALVKETKHKDYVNIFYIENPKYNHVTVLLAEGEKQALFGFSMFHFVLYEKAAIDRSVYNSKHSKNIQISLDLGRLWNSIEFDRKTGQWVNSYYKQKLEDSLIALFGKDGKDISDYVVKKYSEKRAKGDNALVGVCETKTFGNVQVDYYNNDFMAEPGLIFYFTIK